MFLEGNFDIPTIVHIFAKRCVHRYLRCVWLCPIEAILFTLAKLFDRSFHGFAMSAVLLYDIVSSVILLRVILLSVILPIVILLTIIR